MFLDWLDRMRTKPKEVRIQFAFIGAIVITIIIVFIWTFTLPARFNDAEVRVLEEDSEFKRFNELGSIIQETKDSIRNDAEVSEETKKTDSMGRKQPTLFEAEASSSLRDLIDPRFSKSTSTASDPEALSDKATSTFDDGEPPQ